MNCCQMLRSSGMGIVVTVALAVSAGAQGLRNPPEGAAALGHVGASVALTEDASAVSHNPAKLADLKQGQVLPAMTVIRTETDFTGPAGSAKTEKPVKELPDVFAAWPIANTPCVMGVGITTPFGQSMVWKQDGAFRYATAYSASLAVMDVNPTLATRLNDRVSVGVGLDAYWSRLDMKQLIPWSILAQNPMIPDGAVKARGDGEGFGANAGVNFKLTDSQSLALTYRAPFKVDYNGNADVSGMPAAAQALGLTPVSGFNSSIEFPAVAALGYGVKVSQAVNVGADVEWAQSSRYKSLVMDGANNNPLFNVVNPAAPLTLRQDWNDSWTAGFGADWLALPNVTLRAGYIYLWNPIPDETLAPTLPDISRHVVSVGLGYKHARHSFDLAYAYSIIPDRTVSTDQNPGFNGTYETSSQLFGASYTYSF